MAVLAITGKSLLADTDTASEVFVDCRPELDAIVAETSNDTDHWPSLESRLKALETHCEHLPQIAHNLGVLAAHANRLPEAIAHFQRAINLDERAAMTHRHLQQIFEHRAAVAYARALNRPLAATEPTFEFQDSTLLNADSRFLARGRSGLHTISTVEYELYAWWQAHQSQEDLTAHYVETYPDTAIRLAKRNYAGKQWVDMQREIAFTRSDAVVVLSDAEQNRTLLLLRLVGTRWKIYQETAL